MAEAAEAVNPPPPSPGDILDAAATTASAPHATSEDQHSPSPNVLIVDLEGFQLKDFYVLGFLQSSHHDVNDYRVN